MFWKEKEANFFASKFRYLQICLIPVSYTHLAIARAIAKNPDIYIFDDSFSALDFKTDAKLRQELNHLVKKTQSTVLLVGQRIASIMDADQILSLIHIYF